MTVSVEPTAPNLPQQDVSVPVERTVIDQLTGKIDEKSSDKAPSNDSSGRPEQDESDHLEDPAGNQSDKKDNNG